MDSDITWRVSGWDHQVHAFLALGEVASEAACDHTAMTSKLASPSGGERICPACARLHPGRLADLVHSFTHERDRWGQ